jgi:chromosome segregation ATPase
MRKDDKTGQTARDIRTEEIASWEMQEESLELRAQGKAKESNVGDLPDLQEEDMGMPPLPETVNGLASVLVELKGQLMQHIKANEALELDNENARKHGIEAARERDNLLRKMREMDGKTISAEDLMAEISQLRLERDSLTGKVHDLSQRLSTSDQRVKETADLLDHFRSERNDASVEAACLDSQFSRAMKVIEELRGEIQKGSESERKLQGEISVLNKQLKKTERERNNFKSELLESRNALEDVRQSILTASKESHNSFYKG